MGNSEYEKSMIKMYYMGCTKNTVMGLCAFANTG